MADKYTIDFSKLASLEAIRAIITMFLRGKSGTVVYTVHEAGAAGSPVNRRHVLNSEWPMEDHAAMIATDLADNFLKPRNGRIYTHATLEVHTQLS